jgi:hypothetical protein
MALGRQGYPPLGMETYPARELENDLVLKAM